MVEPEVAWLRFDGQHDLSEEFQSWIAARVLDRCAKSWRAWRGTSPSSNHHLEVPFPVSTTRRR